MTMPASRDVDAQRFLDQSARHADDVQRRLDNLEAAVASEVPAVTEVELMDASEAARRLADLEAAARSLRGPRKAPQPRKATT